MKPRLIAAFVLALAGMLGVVLSAQAASLTVCPSGCAFKSIQAAVDAASPGATITIQAGTYSGGVSIDKSLTLNGAGVASTIIRGGGPVISVAAGRVVHISDLTVKGGFGDDGGGIANSGWLTLQRVNVTKNSSVSTGAGIFNDGTLAMFESRVSDNSVDAAFGSGGGISNHGTMTLLNSTVDSNSATGAGGVENSGNLTLHNSDVSYNVATIGGGISNRGMLTIRNSTVNDNTANGDPAIGGGKGGGLYNDGTVAALNSQIHGNKATADPYGVNDDTGFGGGIYNEKGSVTLRNTDVTGNTADRDGGGIYNAAALTLDHSSVTNDTAHRNGGGILNQGGTVTMRHSVMQGDNPNSCVGC